MTKLPPIILDDFETDDMHAPVVDPTVPPGWTPDAYAEAYAGMVKAAGRLCTAEGRVFMEKALATIQAVCTAHASLTVDDVWAALPCEPWEKTKYGSAMGPLMKRMGQIGWMTATAHQRSGRGPTHGHTVVVWQSNVFGGGTGWDAKTRSRT
jgi:hypothetical protein